MSAAADIPKVDENGQPLSKSALKKLAAKAEKEAKKAARAAELAAELEKQQLNEPDECKENYGDLELIQSQKITETAWKHRRVGRELYRENGHVARSRALGASERERGFHGFETRV